MISLSDYPDYEALTEHLRSLEEAVPDLLSLSSIGTSPEGRELWYATVAADGPPPERRPATLVTANMHGRELAGSWVALNLLDRLVEGYGEDDELTDLLDEQVIYVVPRVSPDGAEATIETRSRIVRSRLVDVPEDERRPGALYHEDVNGDGRILRMRWRSEDGEMTTHPDDDRLLVERSPEDDGPFYRTEFEGTVHRYEGDEIAGHEAKSDFNRNFPDDAWRPFDWAGHGKYPLSEPETRALGEFLFDHPNVTTVADLHTGNPAIFYPGSLVEPDGERQSDADLHRRIGERGEEITGFPYLSGYAEAYGEPTPELPGSFKSFAYDRTGAVSLLVELGMCYNSLGLETSDLGRDDHQLERTKRMMEYHEEHPDEGLFVEWEPFDHPQLGEVEIGGWDWLRYSNPPREEMDEIAGRTTDFLLEFAEYAPAVSVRNLSVERLEGELYHVTADVVNRGSLPTNLTDNGPETRQDDRPVASLEGNGEVIPGSRYRELEHLDARTGRTSLEWVVEASAGTTIELVVESRRGVFARGSATLGD